jgi:thiol-disulfide isomerase/thioredoxin
MCAAVAVVTVTAACGGSDDAGDSSWPSVEVVSATGDEVDTGSWTGEPMVVNFWYSTCAPCAEELQHFATVDDEVDGDVRFVGINPLDTPERMIEFADERGVAYELFQDPLAELQGELGITSFPATYFVSSSGEIVAVTAALDAAELRLEIDELLAAEAA